MNKWIKKIGLGIFVLFLFVIMIVHGGMKVMAFSDEDASIYFEEREFDGKIENIVVNDVPVKIVSDKPQDSDSILLVFVHGAPGTWDAFKEYITDKDIFQNTRVVAYDRPGYGGSSENVIPGIQDQAEVLIAIVERFGLKKNILVGHSFGGPIAAMCGVDKRVNADAVIMIAPLIDPKSEPIFWYSYFSHWKLTSWILPSELVVAGSEKFAHSNELKKIEDRWGDGSCRFIHVHGLEDGLAPGKENIEFSKSHIPKENLETIIYNDKGHLILWTEYDLMKEIIINAIKNQK